ncbi:ASCH domain-containing protein [Mesorhizobium japonicum]|uniref:ASCH domain-containing protein n=1 Tax=Mesorhizobium japonicum TaxID=2066070 RepID=UPI003B5B9086
MSYSQRLLAEIEAHLPRELAEQYFCAESRRGVHVAVMREPFLSLLVAGQKTIESRFSRNRMDPYRRVEPGDLVLLKAGMVVGGFVVGSVDYRELGAGDLSSIQVDLNDSICADDGFWGIKAEARFATLLEVSDVMLFDPFPISKRDMRGWVVLRSAIPEDVLAW